MPPTSANQITWSRLLIKIHTLNDKQRRSKSVGFFRSQLIWIYTVCKGRVYLGSAGEGLIAFLYKALYFQSLLVKLDTIKFCCSYFQHIFRKCDCLKIKCSLSAQWNEIHQQLIQRIIFSSWTITNLTNTHTLIKVLLHILNLRNNYSGAILEKIMCPH